MVKNFSSGDEQFFQISEAIECIKSSLSMSNFRSNQVHQFSIRAGTIEVQHIIVLSANSLIACPFFGMINDRSKITLCRY